MQCLVLPLLPLPPRTKNRTDKPFRKSSTGSAFEPVGMAQRLFLRKHHVTTCIFEIAQFASIGKTIRSDTFPVQKMPQSRNCWIAEK